MKKLLLITGGVVFGTLLIFNSCTKTNVKNPKKIIGTWTLESWTGEYTSNDTYTETYTPTTDCWANYSDVEIESGSIDVSSAGINEIYSYTRTEDGVVTETEAYDSTYVNPEYVYSITFNEDGTCTVIESYSLTDENSNTDSNYMEYTGYWNWLDAYEEKMGLNIVMAGGPRKALEPNRVYEMFFYINSFDKDIMEFTYVSKSINTYESDYVNTCWLDEVVVTNTETGNYTYNETGERVMNKQE